MEKLNDKDYTGVMYNNWHFTKILKVLSEKNQITKCTDCFVL